MEPWECYVHAFAYTSELCAHILCIFLHTLAGPGTGSLVQETKMLQWSQSNQAVTSMVASTGDSLDPSSLQDTTGGSLPIITELCRLAWTLVMKLDMHLQVLREQEGSYVPFPLGRNCLCSQTKVIGLFRFRVCLSLLGEDVVLSVGNITSATSHYITLVRM